MTREIDSKFEEEHEEYHFGTPNQENQEHQEHQHACRQYQAVI